MNIKSILEGNITPQSKAIALYDIGLTAIPLVANTKQPHKDFEYGEYLHNRPSREVVGNYFQGHTGNTGLLLGAVSKNLCVIDFDNIVSRSLFQVLTYPPLLNTLEIQTRRGSHYYYFVQNMPGGTYKINHNVDVKCSGYVVAPGSVYRESVFREYKYTIKNDASIMTIGSLNYLALERLEHPKYKPEFPKTMTARTDDTYNQKKILINEIKKRMSMVEAIGNFAKNEIHLPQNSAKKYVQIRCPHPKHLDVKPSARIFHKDKDGMHFECFDPDCPLWGNKPTNPTKHTQQDVIDVYQRLNNLTQDEALYELGQFYGLDVSFLEIE